MSEMVKFNYTDTDYIAFLLTLGYEIDSFEVIKNKKGGQDVHVFIIGEKDKLIQHYKDYMNNEVLINLNNYKTIRKKIAKEFKIEILKHQMKNLR